MVVHYWRDDSSPRQDRAVQPRIYHTTQNGLQLKTHESFTSGNFHLVFSDHSLPEITITTASKTLD
jgi:hypothetical protein